MQNPIALLGMIALVGAATFLWLAPTAAPDRLAAASGPRLAPAAIEARGAQEPALPPLPPSLRGTRPRGALTVGPDGHFAPTPAALELFDFYLAALGEEPPEQISQRVQAAIRGRLAPGPAAEAEALWDRYLAYREALVGPDDARRVDGVDLEQRIQWIRELRREHFGADAAEALFAERERLERYAVERERVLADPSLDPATRQERLSQLQGLLPQPVPESRRRAIPPLRMREQVEALRAESASAAEVRQLRAELFGKEAAERLAEADRERVEFEGRLARYLEEREALRADPEQDEEAIDALREQHFQGPERERVRLLEQAFDASGPP